MLKPAIRVQIIIIRVLTLSSVKWHIKLSISVSITHASGRCVSMHFDNINKNLKIKNKEKKRGGLRVGVSKGHDSWLPGASLATLASEPCWLTVALVTQHAFALHPDLWRRLQTPALKIASIKSIYIAEYAQPCKKEKKMPVKQNYSPRGLIFYMTLRLYSRTVHLLTFFPEVVGGDHLLGCISNRQRVIPRVHNVPSIVWWWFACILKACHVFHANKPVWVVQIVKKIIHNSPFKITVAAPLVHVVV